MKITIVDQIEITRLGHIQVRMRKQVIDDGDVFDVVVHRALIEVGSDVVAKMAELNKQLIAMGAGAVDAQDIAEIKKHAAVAFTTDRVAAFKAAKPIAIGQPNGAAASTTTD